MNKKFFTSILLFIVFHSYAQDDFTFKTIYKQNPINKFENEDFTFKYEKINKILTITDDDLKVIRKRPVEFYDSTYSKDGKFYIVAFMSDLDKFKGSTRDKSFIGMFTFFYDKKNGELLWVQVVSILEDVSGHPNKADYYYTQKGKTILEAQ